MTAIAVRLEGSTWVEYLPPPGHAQHGVFMVLRHKTFARNCHEQKTILDEHHQKSGRKDLFVATTACTRSNRG